MVILIRQGSGTNHGGPSQSTSSYPWAYLDIAQRTRLTLQQEHEAKITQTSGQDALSHAIQAAELYMKAVGEAPSAAAKTRLRRKCRELIALAETLKNQRPTLATPQITATTTTTPATPASAPAPAPAPPSNAPKPKGPRQTRTLPTGEKTILLRSSKLHGNVFPPWDHDPDPAAFRSKRLDEPPFT